MEIEEEFISGFCRTMNGGETVCRVYSQQTVSPPFMVRQKPDINSSSISIPIPPSDSQ